MKELAKEIIALVESKQQIFLDVSDQIWCLAEPAFQETASSALQREIMAQEGFIITEALDGIPTAFCAQFGAGHPIIGLLGEFDALEGLSQAAGKPTQEPLSGAACGHGCGHNGLGAGAMAAAVAVKDYLEAHGLTGTVRYYGCPAEEAGWAKAFMVKDGCFRDLDAALSWHPWHTTNPQAAGMMANLCGEFTFHGISSHAAASPHLGRSALDACELMNVGVNYLREHIVPDARIHYAYLNAGGNAPNVIQAEAKLRYFIRARRVRDAKAIAVRVDDIARGAALMTGTAVEIAYPTGMCDLVINSTISRVLGEALTLTGGPKFDKADQELARAIRASLGEAERSAAWSLAARVCGGKEHYREKALIGEAFPYQKDDFYLSGSSDVGDVSYVAPTGFLNVTAFANGTPMHSWQLTAQSGSSIMHKAIPAAAKALAVTAVHLITHPELLEEAWLEHRRNAGDYTCPMGPEARPPL